MIDRIKVLEMCVSALTSELNKVDCQSLGSLELYATMRKISKSLNEITGLILNDCYVKHCGEQVRLSELRKGDKFWWDERPYEYHSMSSGGWILAKDVNGVLLQSITLEPNEIVNRFV